MRQGKLLARWMFAACLALSAPTLVGCDDENDPKTWVKKLGDDRKRPGATERLSKLFEDRMRSTNPVNDCANKGVQDFLNVALQPLVDQFNAHPDEVSMRQKAMSIFTQCKDPRALSAIIKSVVFKPGVSDSETLADSALGAIKNVWGEEIPADKKPEVINALVEAVKGATGGTDRTKQLRGRAIEALGALKAPAAVGPLTDLIMKPLNEIDPAVTVKAIDALGEIGAPDGVDGIIYALFLNFKNAPIEGHARNSLGKIGIAAAKQKLLDLLDGKNEKVKKLVNQYVQSQDDVIQAPNWYSDVGNMHEQYYAAKLLSDFGFAEAKAPLLALLNNASAPELVRGTAAKSLARMALSLDAASRKEILDTLRAMLTAADMQGLLDVVENGGHWIGALALDAIVTIGDVSAVPDILKIMRDPVLNPKTATPENMEKLLAFRLKLLNQIAAMSRRSDLGIKQDLEKFKLDVAALSNKENFKSIAENVKKSLDNIDQILKVGQMCGDGDIECLVGKVKDTKTPKDDLYKLLQIITWDTPAEKRDLVRKALLSDGIVNHFDTGVRVFVFYALDAVSPNGSKEVIDRIQRLLAEEKEGNESKKLSHLFAYGLVARLAARK